MKKILNILLISAPYSHSYGKMKAPVHIHLGLAYIASVLKHSGSNVEIIDMVAEDLNTSDFVKILEQKKYDIAGFTVTTPTFFSSLHLAGQIKRYSPNTLTIFGGIHPTIKPRETMEFDSVDIVVKGEGEITFKEIVETVKSSRDFSTVKGLLYRENGQVKETPARAPLENLDFLPFPERNLFKQKQYTYPDALYKLPMSILMIS